MASRTVAPRSRACTMNSTFTIASLSTMPTRITTPISEIVLIPCPVIISAATAPISASGAAARITAGTTNDSNCAARIM